jgi:hypothetical protein
MYPALLLLLLLLLLVVNLLLLVCCCHSISMSDRESDVPKICEDVDVQYSRLSIRVLHK